MTMRYTRREITGIGAAMLGAPRLQAADYRVQKGPFAPEFESLAQYRCPDWFRDAKLGIWAVWDPGSVPMQGDWYARNMYVEGSRQYKYHVAHYGHPSTFGYKDLIPLWKAENWNPDELIGRYKKAGAKYFVSIAAFCDNFDCWNSKHHRWNSVNFGPKKDVVGIWGKTARRHGLRFGVSEHLAWSYSWFNVNKGADKTGSMAGVPYDGNDPKYRDLYHEPHEENKASYPQNPSEAWRQSWFLRMRDLIDQHHPDLFYTDGALFGEQGRRLLTHYYNSNARRHGGQQDGVYNIKISSKPGYGTYKEGIATLDIERGVVDSIRDQPWQTDSCIGYWHYWEGYQYKTVHQIVHMLGDILSKNGNLLLNIPPRPDGTLDEREIRVLDEFTAWMAVHSEAIYGTRPFGTYGEGPTTIKAGFMGEKEWKPFTAADVRFTKKGNVLYAWVMGPPERQIHIRSLGTAANLWDRPIAGIRILGSSEQVRWKREAEDLMIEPPAHIPSEYAVIFRIEG